MAPLTIMRLRSSSIRTTSRFWMVLRHRAHMAGHLLALEHPPRSLVLADGAGHAMGLGIAVGGVLAAEMVPLDGAGKALSDGGAGDVHMLPGRETGHGDLGTGLIVLKLGGIVETVLEQALAGSVIGVLTGQRLARRLAGFAHRDLDGRVAVLVRRALAGHAVRIRLNHGDGHTGPFLRKQARHSPLLADQTNIHAGGS